MQRQALSYLGDSLSGPTRHIGEVLRPQARPLRAFIPETGIVNADHLSTLRKATFGNGLTETHGYNQRFQPCRSNFNSSGTYLSTCTDAIPSGNVLDLHPTFNAGSTDNSNVAIWSAAGGLTFNRTYAYDALNRIQSMTDSDSSQACKGMSYRCLGKHDQSSRYWTEKLKNM